MKFLDRKEELYEIKRVLNSSQKTSLIVVYGRRRLGKSTLIKRALNSEDIYYVAGEIVDRVQIDDLKKICSEKFPELKYTEFSSWEDLFKMINVLTKERFTLCLDEFPFMVKQSQGLTSLLQRLIDSGELKYNIIVCGSSQRMMHNLVLSKSEPLYGRARLIINLKGIPISYFQDAFQLSAIEAVEEYSVWGGVPRYWELREDFNSLFEAIKSLMLNTGAVLFDEPKHLFLDDMTTTVQSESLMAVIAGGSNRISEIASRMGRDSTALSAPIDKLIQMGYIKREIPFGEDIKKSKRGLYSIKDPLIDFYYKYIIPNISNIERGRLNYVMNQIKEDFNRYVSLNWEYLCREAVSGNLLFDKQWGEAKRWWGSIKKDNEIRQMEFDVIAESNDGNSILIGECKWTNKEDVVRLQKNLVSKSSLLPFAANKEIIPVLFLKNKPSDLANINQVKILYPEDIIKLI